MNFYLDTMLSEMLDDKGYAGQEHIKNMIANSSYFGIGKEYLRTKRPGAGFQYVMDGFKISIAEFFSNSLLGFYEMVYDLLQFLGAFIHLPKSLKTYDKIQSPFDDPGQMKELLHNYQKLINHQLDIDLDNLSIIVDIVFDLKKRIESIRTEQSYASVGTSTQVFKSEFFAQILALIYTHMKPGNLKTNVLAKVEHVWETDSSFADSDYRFPFNLRSVLQRPLNKNKLISSNDRMFKLFREKYELIEEGPSDLRRDVNNMIIFSGFQCDVFIRLVRDISQKHTWLPGQFAARIFEEYMNKIINLDLMHSHFGDSTSMDEEVLKKIMNEVLVMKPKRIQKVQGMDDPQPGPELMEVDYTNLQFYKREKADTSSFNPLWILLLVALLCYFFFV